MNLPTNAVGLVRSRTRHVTVSATALVPSIMCGPGFITCGDGTGHTVKTYGATASDLRAYACRAGVALCAEHGGVVECSGAAIRIADCSRY